MDSNNSYNIGCTISEPCHRVEDVHFYDQEHEDVLLLLNTSTTPYRNGMNCTYSLNISWSMILDSRMRNQPQIESIECQFVINDGANFCTTRQLVLNLGIVQLILQHVNSRSYYNVNDTQLHSTLHLHQQQPMQLLRLHQLTQPQAAPLILVR